MPRSASSRRHRGADGVAYQVNAVTELAVGEGATGCSGRGSRPRATGRQHIGTPDRCASAAARSSIISSSTAGAALSRWQVFVTPGGEHARLGLRRQHAVRPRARRPDAGHRACRAPYDQPRALQERHRRRGAGRLPGPHRGQAGRPEDRRQDDDAGAPPLRPRRVRFQAGARDLRRRRPVRPRRHLRPDRRDAALLPDGPRRSARRGRAPADRGVPRRRHRRDRRRGDRRRAEGHGRPRGWQSGGGRHERARRRRALRRRGDPPRFPDPVARRSTASRWSISTTAPRRRSRRR